MHSPLPSPDGNDLSQGVIPVADQASIGLGLAEQAHRFRLQNTIANSALALSAVVFMAAMVFGGVLIYLLAKGEGDDIHWHASILVGAFVVPPTVIMIALLRSAYQSKDNKDKDDLPMPLLTLIREIATAIADVFKAKS